MVKRFDLSDKDLKYYSQYYKDINFIEKENVRFVKWNDIPENIKTLLKDN